MPGHIIWDFAPQPLKMRHLPVSNSAYLPSTCDEELADEADEPPDNRSEYSPLCLSDSEFHKSAILHTPPVESLLTKALASPPLIPVDQFPSRQQPQRGMSSSSAWSVASTAELTSDGLTSPSRANTPSPPPPLYLSGMSCMLASPKAKFALPPPIYPAPSTEQKNTVGGLEQKRRITFACANGRPSGTTEKPQAVKTEPATQTRRSALTFVCNKPADRVKETEPIRPARLRSPAPKRITHQLSKSDIESESRDDQVALERWYGSEGAAESWTLQPFDKTRLLRVDDLLKKEQEIRRLSEEAEEEDEDDALDDDDQEDDEDDTFEQDEEDEDEELYLDEDDEDDDYDGESGNETDNEEGFASDDESDDELFFGPQLPPQTTSNMDTVGARKHASSPRRIRSPSPQPPDNTEFVCGTFDEDKPLEDAYLSALEEWKRAKHIPTPQDIDPSFPVDDDDDDEEDEQPQPVRRKSDAGRVGSVELKKANRSPLRGRAPSPAPVRRRSIAVSPAPLRRVIGSPGSRQISRQASQQNSRQTSRQTSPIPRRGRSPAPARGNGTHIQFATGRVVVRTHSLPRNGPGYRRAVKTVKTSGGAPGEKKARPMPIKRSAMDIYEGLEKRRERRKAKLARKAHEGERRVGEGVEKMRELALDLCGRGRRQAQWVMSA